jgi:sulfate/thiosulfate transport system permease protein
MTAKLTLRWIALGYLGLLLMLPVAMVFWQALQGGLEPVWQAVTRPAALHALYLTVLIALIAVPANTIFGVLCALALVRSQFRGKRLFDTAIDIPFTISPVIVGLALIIVYGKTGWLGGWLGQSGVQVIFALPGMVLATIFVSLPFVVREVVPVLREIGTDQEEAASILGASSFQTFWQVTLPSIRWGVIYGVVLTTARALGEYGAVSVVSGKIAGRTETLTTHVEERFQAFDMVGTYSASIVLALLALATLLAMNFLSRSREDVS